MLTNSGKPLEIIDPGAYNPNAGPDFFNAKIKIDGRLWAGNIEIHTAASDWYRHRHDMDSAYNSVVLHVVEYLDVPDVFDSSQRVIPQWEMQIPDRVAANYRFLTGSDLSVPCLERIREIPAVYLADWKSALLTERLERKTDAVLQLFDETGGDWNSTFYVTLARNFGFGVNNDAFERLSRSLPLKLALRHSDSPMQIEALFLGQAGLLETEETADEYYIRLRKEYRFLRKKYRLKPLEAHLFKMLRMRPANFPHVKILQLAGVISQKQGLFSQILETEDDGALHTLFSCEPGEYWLTHYHFGKTSAVRHKYIGMQVKQLLLINAVAPLFFAYGIKTGTERHIDRAVRLLETLAPERNHIITMFSRAGIAIANAGDTQALIQLKREYCEKKKCIFCRIGHKLLSE
jgi:hypothetical protein